MTKQYVKVKMVLADPLQLPVDKRKEGEKTKIFFSYSNEPPITAQLYAELPQDKKKSHGAVPHCYMVCLF